MTSREDNFLARWAQRKTEVAKAEALEKDSLTTPENCPQAAEDTEPFDLASLPTLESITAETDIRPFMNALVPEGLRNAALRRMWELDIAIRDYVSPATEYAWDWNQTGGAQGYGPLEAGYKAFEIAEKMISQKNEHNTLVEGGDTDLANASVADASPGSKGAEWLPTEEPEPKPLVEIKTVRLSTKTDAGSYISGDPQPSAADDSANSPRGTDIFASQHSSARHGRATPR